MCFKSVFLDWHVGILLEEPQGQSEVSMELIKIHGIAGGSLHIKWQKVAQCYMIIALYALQRKILDKLEQELHK